MAIRDVSLDNAKGALILLVVLGHLVYPIYSPSTATNALYDFIYFFHMPMFILLAGYLSKPVGGLNGLTANARQLLAPFAIFAAIHWLLLRLTGQEPVPTYDSIFGLWFLFSLFWWRLLLPLLAPVRYILPLSVLAALACGAVSQIGLSFSLSRTIVFFPFFLAGHQMRSANRSPLELLPRPAAAVVIVAMAGLCLFLVPWNIQYMLAGTFSYEALNIPLLLGPGLRAVHLGLALLAGIAFLALIPRRESILTTFGRHSLHVYLLHTVPLVVYRASPANYEVLGQSPLLMIPVAFLLTWLLSSPLVVRLTTPLVSPLKK